MSTVMEKVAEVDPDTYQFLVGIAPAIKTSPFHEEIVGEMDGIIKRAGMMGHVGTQLGVNVAGGIAMALAGDMYEAAKRGLTKSRNYRNMLDANPDLKKLPKTQVMDAFNVLHQFNPEFAGNPTVSGAFVRKNSQYPEFDVKQLGELVGSHKNLQDSKKLPNANIKLPDDQRHNPLEDEGQRLQNEGQRMRNSMTAMDLGRNMSDKGSPGYSELGMAARARMTGHKGSKSKK